MKEFVDIKTKDPVVQVNFEEAKKKLEQQLKKYDVVVTVDTVKDAKKLSTELNKQATSIDTKRKDAVYNVSLPIRAFEAEMKHLVSMCKDGREKINSQVKKFEDETRADVELLLDGLRGSLWHDIGVEEKFQSAEISDLILLTSITAKGALTGKVKNEVESRVNRDKQQQIEIEMRLLQLENRCFKAGLRSVLTETHVEAFLYAPEAEYNKRLDSLIYVEVKRQEETEAAIKKENEEKPVIVEKKEEPIDNDFIDKSRPNVEKKVDKVADESIKSGNVQRVVTAVFVVSVPEEIGFERIGDKLTTMLVNAGITSLQSIQVK